MASCEVLWRDKTKPTGSLGRLETIATRLAGIQRSLPPQETPARLLLFAGSHGVADAGVSAYPSIVNLQMLANFRAGGAAINVLCRHSAIALSVVDCGVAAPTKNIAVARAMTSGETRKAFLLGWNSVPRDTALLGLGEMGIGNTTIASALTAACLQVPVTRVTGVGTGVGERQRRQKMQVIRAALDLHRLELADPWTRLQAIGGREIAAIVGAILRAVSWRIPVFLDGFIVTAAATVALEMCPSSRYALFASHRSSEPGHDLLLKHLGLDPLLDLGLCLGEGTGAALAISLAQVSLRLLREMATFSSAGVATSESAVA